MSTFKCSKRELILFYINNRKDISVLQSYLRENYNVSENEITFITKEFQKTLLPQFNKRWTKVARGRDTFLRDNNQWLDTEFSVVLPVSMDEDECDETTTSPPSTSSGPR